MKSKKASIIFLFLSLFLLSSASFVIAEGLVPCDGASVPCDFDQLGNLVDNIINWILAIATTIAAISFTYAGAMMVLHPDNPGEKEAAKDIFKKTVIGLALVLISWVIVTTIVKTVAGDSTPILKYFNT